MIKEHLICFNIMFMPQYTDDFENEVREHFERLGYAVKKAYPTSLEYEKGHPDFIASKKDRTFYIEVKSLRDQLSKAQFMWILNNPNKWYILVWAENESIWNIINKAMPQYPSTFQIEVI